MLVSISWLKGGKRQFGRVMQLDRATELCHIMSKRTGVKHFPCRYSEHISSLVDTSVPEHLNPIWVKFKKYEMVVNNVIQKLKRNFRGIEYEDFKSSVEFEVYRLLPLVPDICSKEENSKWLLSEATKVCNKLFMENRSDIYRRGGRSTLDTTFVTCETPESLLIQEDYEQKKAKAFYYGLRSMTKMERTVFKLLTGGASQTTIANKLHLSKARVSRLKSRACNKVSKIFNSLEVQGQSPWERSV